MLLFNNNLPVIAFFFNALTNKALHFIRVFLFLLFFWFLNLLLNMHITINLWCVDTTVRTAVMENESTTIKSFVLYKAWILMNMNINYFIISSWNLSWCCVCHMAESLSNKISRISANLQSLVRFIMGLLSNKLIQPGFKAFTHLYSIKMIILLLSINRCFRLPPLACSLDIHLEIYYRLVRLKFVTGICVKLFCDHVHF